MDGSKPDHAGEAPLDRERLGVLFILAVVVVAVVAVLAFATIGPVAGLVVIVAAVAGVFAVAFRGDRRAAVEVAPTGADAKRVLVIANEGLGAGTLSDAIADQRVDGERLAVHVVVPALTEPGKRLASDVDGAREGAERSLRELVTSIEGTADEVSGEVGDSDPRLALEDALRARGADHVIVVNPRSHEMGDLERSVTARADRDVPVPTTEINV